MNACHGRREIYEYSLMYAGLLAVGALLWLPATALNVIHDAKERWTHGSVR